MKLKIISLLMCLFFLPVYSMEKSVLSFVMLPPKALLDKVTLPSKLMVSSLKIMASSLDKILPSPKTSLLLATTAATGYCLYDYYQKTHIASQEKLYAKDFDRLGVRYLDHLEVQDSPENKPDAPLINLHKQYSPENLPEAPLINLHEKYGHLIQFRHHAPVYLSFINNKVGYGVFADTDIKKDQMIAEYTGVLRKSPEPIRSRGSLINMHDFDYIWTYIPDAKVDIDAKEAGNFTRFVNHSLYPNVKILYIWNAGLYHLIYVAQSDIKKDEQLLVNYGAGYWYERGINPAQFRPLVYVALENTRKFYDYMHTIDVPYYYALMRESIRNVLPI